MVTIKGKGLTVPGLMIACCLGITFSVNSQVKAPQITPLSPNAASMWKYSELPVNLYTGRPTINIPLYEIKTGNLTVPINLSYHSGGVRYEEQASWVGLGWNLHAGGTISRNVKHVPDESNEGLLKASTLINFNAQNCDYGYFENALNKVFDTQPDEFSYSLPSANGRFIFKQGVTHPIFVPYAPVKLGYSLNSLGFANMAITDENGTVYQFGQTETTTGGSGAFVEYNYPSAWLLTQMQSADLARTITFNYLAGAGTVHKSTKSDYIRVVDNVVGGGASGSICQPPTPTIYGYVTSNQSYTTTVKYLSEILFDNGKIEFVQSSTYRTDIANNQKSLEFVRIYSLRDGVYTLVKSIKFFYTYFKKLNNAVLQDHKLKLDKIQVLGADASVQEEYSFQYHTTTFSGNLNNAQDINAQDWWGYYNGKTGNTNMIPQQTITYVSGGGSSQVSIGGADRSVDPAYMTEGVLKRITYPAGGYTEFEFETHQYNDNGTKYAGGLRIKKITSLASANDVPMTKTYKYGLGGNGYGQKMFYNNLGYFATEDRKICIATVINAAHITHTERIFNSVSNMQIDGFEGSPVVYPNVTEYFGTESTNNGRIEYVYDNGTSIGDNVYLPYMPVTNIFQRQSNDYLRGHLTSKTVYSAANNKVSATSTAYQTLHPIDTLVGLMVFQRFYFLNEVAAGCYTDGGVYKYNFNFYPIRSGAVRPLQITDIAYDPGDHGRFQTNETSFEYDANYLVQTGMTKNLRKLPTGYEEQIINYSKYPFSYSFSGAPSGAEAQGIKLLQDKNIATAPVEQYTVRRYKDPTVWQTEVIAGVVTSYRTDRPYPDKVWQIETTAPINSASFGSGSTIVSNAFSKNAAYREKLIYTGYDILGNITQYNKAYDLNTSYIWDYNNMYVVAEITNADSNNIAFTSFEAQNKGKWTYSGTPAADPTAPTGKKAYLLNGANNIVRTGLSTGTTYIVSYWIKNTSPLTITGTVGSPVVGRTLGLWRHYEHRVTGQSSVTITGNVAVDELRVYPVGALMTTFTHDPLVGIASQCDPANRISYFEYDVVGRLQIVRDLNRNIIKTYEYRYKTP